MSGGQFPSVSLLKVGNDHSVPQIAISDHVPATEIDLYLGVNPMLKVVF